VAGISFGGLASGLDTNTMVTQLMAVERMPQVRVQQKQLVEEARLSALNDVKTRLSNLSLKIAGLRDATTWGDTQTAESSDATRVAVTRTGGAPAGAHTVEIVQLARAAQVTQGTASQTAPTTGTLSFTVGSSTLNIDVAAGDSLDAIASKINGSSNTPVYAGVITLADTTKRLVITGKATGATNTVAVGGSVAADFGFAQSLSPLDAEYYVNDPGHTSLKTSSTNVVTNAISGLSLTFKATTTSPVTVTVGNPAPDTKKIEEKIKDFVDQYNSTIDFINGKLNEQKVRNATTSADRAKGVLNADTGLSSLLSQLRQTIGSVFSDLPVEAQTLAQVGVSTGASTGSGVVSQDAIAGKLTLDSTKLSEQLSARFADVKNLFTDTTVGTEGMAQKLDAVIDPWLGTSGILSSRITSEEAVIDSLRTRSEEMETRLQLREKSLRAEFTAMEKALQNAQQQGSWLSGQLASLGI
jgi:flagellar hook-associated protein 2